MAGINAYDRIEYGEFKMPSLQEMMIAPQYLTQQFEQAEQALLENQTLAADVATRFQPGIDDEAIQANAQFQESVQADINDLNKVGLTPNIRKRLLQRKMDFNNTILPLNKAAVDRERWANAAREAKLKDPSLIIKDPMAVGLNTWISDPTSHELHAISGNDIYERTKAEMIPISKYIEQNLPELANSGIPYQYFTYAQAGATAEDIASLMSDDFRTIDPAKLSPLAQLIKNAADKVIASTGVYDYYGADSDEAMQAIAYSASAFNHALGTKLFGNMTDRYNMELAIERSKPKKSSGQESQDTLYPYLGTRTNVEVKGKIDRAQDLVLGLKELLDSPSTVDTDYWNEQYNNYVKNFNLSQGVLRAGSGGSRAGSAQPQSREAFMSGVRRAKQETLKKIKEEARALGINISETDNINTLINEINRGKKSMAIGSKEYPLNEAVDGYFIETLNAQLDSQRTNKEVVDGLKVSDFIDDNGDLKPGYQYAFNKDGLVVVEYGKSSKKNKVHPINTALLTDDIYRQTSQIKQLYDPSFYENYSLDPVQIRALRMNYPEVYGALSDEEIEDAYLNDLQSRLTREAVERGYTYGSVRNKQIDVKP